MDQEEKKDAATAGINIAGGRIDVGADIVGRDKIIHEAPAAPIPALHQLPPPPRDFTGRHKEIAELMAAVEKGGVTISGLQGLGGVGKTALALKLADEFSGRFPDAQLYLDLKGVSSKPLETEEAMAHVIRSFHPDIKLPDNEAELSGLYRSVLHGRRALLLMDNAKDAKQTEPLIPPPGCLLLLTSRQHFAIPGIFAKNLEALSPGDARDLLLGIARRLVSEKEDYSGELIRLCGYLPLAIRSVASALAARIDLRPADCVRRLADARERLRLTETDASLGLSCDLLAPESQKQFGALAVFPDTFVASAAAAVWGLEPDPAQDLLGELVRYSLVEFNSETHRYRLHDLVRVFADSRLESSERAVSQKRHAKHYMAVTIMADEFYLKGNESVRVGLSLFDTEWENIQTGQAWAAGHASENDEAARLCSTYPIVGEECLTLRLHPREQMHWAERGLAAARRLQDRGAEGAHLNHLGLACRKLGEYRRAIDYHELHLQITRERGSRRGESAALSNLCIAWSCCDEHRRAIELAEQALAIDREIGDPRGEAYCLGNMGNAYYALGEYGRAINCHEQSLQIVIRIGDRVAEAAALGNLGNAYYSLGEFLKAIEYQEQKLQISNELGDRDSEGNAHWCVSLALDKLGKRAEAIAHAEEALRIRSQVDSPLAAKVRIALAAWRGEGKPFTHDTTQTNSKGSGLNRRAK
jgi:tetratricopeptide (TPR) repeat protein